MSMEGGVTAGRFERVGLDPLRSSSVTNLSRPAERVTLFYNQRGSSISGVLQSAGFFNQRAKAEPYIKEGKNAIEWARLSCRKFRNDAVRLQLHAPAYNLANFMRTLALPEEVEHWSLTTLRKEAGQDRGQSGPARPVRHVPIGRGGGAEGDIPENPEPD
jgi:hypothetical protein